MTAYTQTNTMTGYPTSVSNEAIFIHSDTLLPSPQSLSVPCKAFFDVTVVICEYRRLENFAVKMVEVDREN